MPFKLPFCGFTYLPRDQIQRHIAVFKQPPLGSDVLLRNAGAGLPINARFVFPPSLQPSLQSGFPFGHSEIYLHLRDAQIVLNSSVLRGGTSMKGSGGLIRSPEPFSDSDLSPIPSNQLAAWRDSPCSRGIFPRNGKKQCSNISRVRQNKRLKTLSRKHKTPAVTAVGSAALSSCRRSPLIHSALLS